MWKTFNTFFLISFLTHAGLIFYDVIEFNMNFDFNLKEKKHIEQVHANTEVAKKSKHAPEQKEMLETYFKEELKEIETAAKERYKKERASSLAKGKGEGKNPIKVNLSGSGEGNGQGKENPLAAMMQKTINQGGGSFQPAKIQSLSEDSAVSHKNGLIYQGSKKEVKFSDECKGGQKYVGLGFAIEAPPENQAQNLKYQNKIPWQINQLAAGHVAERNQMKSGDVFLGVINKEGRFFEGNTFLAEKYPKGTWIKVLWRQGNELIKKDVQLEEICYYPEKGSKP